MDSFGCLGMHLMLGFIIADKKVYKVSWFQDNGHAYGNIEFSMILGVVGFTLITAMTVCSLFGTNYWMKLKPMHASFVSHVGILMSTVHAMCMG